MDIVIMIAQLLLALTILVGIHEFGHFIAAKGFKMRVDRFFIFFNPWFKLWSKKVGETEYGIGWLPLGGYVKIAGMIDESMDKEQMAEEPKEWEFRSKSTWARLIVMIGGVTMNVILGMAIFAGLVMTNGVTYLPAEELNKHGIVAYDVAQEMGLETGDKILALSGQPIERMSDLLNADLVLNDNVTITVERDGQKVDVPVPSDLADKLADQGGSLRQTFIAPRYTFSVGMIQAGSNADKGGLLKGDVIQSIDNEDVRFFDQLQEVLAERSGKEVAVSVDRGGQVQQLTMSVHDDGTIGFMPLPQIKYSTEKFGFFGSIVRGSGQAWKSLWDSIKGFGKVMSGKLSFQKSMSGPIGIAAMYGADWDWTRFWTLTGVLSMWLAFINLVPIPALDGGHVAFLLYEMITGRKPNDKFMEIMQIIGLVIILSLMVFIIGNDIIKLIN